MKTKKRMFNARGKKLKDSWYRFVVATDPDHEGNGLVPCC